MLASTIVLVVIRLFCVQWFVHGLSYSALALAESSPITPTFSRPVFILAQALSYLVLAIVVWFLAPFIARLITGSRNTPITIPSVSLADLYAFAFVFLGIYFFVSSLGNVLDWFYFFFITAASRGDYDPQRKASFFQFSRYIITLLAGLACIYYGRFWARRLVAKDYYGQNTDGPTDLSPS